jgi:hypothetical protein
VEERCPVKERRSCALLLPHDPPEIRIGKVQQALQLGDPLLADITGGVAGPGLVQETLRLFLVGACHVEGMFQGCLVLESRVMFHDTSVVPFPG